MTFSDDPSQHIEPDSQLEPQPSSPAEPQSLAPPEPVVAFGQSPYSPRPPLPEDLRISWSWPHFLLFLFFALASFFVVQTSLIIYYAPHRGLPPKELERYLLNKPEFLFGSNLLWYAAIFLFLY